MPEINPQITFSPGENLLELRHKPGPRRIIPTYDLAAKQEAIDELRDSNPGITTEKEGDQEVTKMRLDDVGSHATLEARSDRLLQVLDRLAHFHDKPDGDLVIETGRVIPMIFSANVHPHFQRWLEAEGLNEETARDMIRSMAYPFGKRAQSKADRTFGFEEAGDVTRAWSEPGIEVVAKDERFEASITRPGRTAGTHERKMGRVSVRTMTLRTIGGATMGPSRLLGDAGRWIQVDAYDAEVDRTRKLYTLDSDEFDEAPQPPLSILLGLSAAAARAARYSGRGDVIEDLRWIGEIDTTYLSAASPPSDQSEPTPPAPSSRPATRSRHKKTVTVDPGKRL